MLVTETRTLERVGVNEGRERRKLTVLSYSLM